MVTYRLSVDAVFKALSDPTRRALLDSLRDKGGQTLTELEAGLGMTRFGVMKHLKVLEEADLVVTRKAGRFKHHYLNALPIQEVADRWMAPYAKPLARFALDLKNSLEEPIMTDKPNFVLQTYIRTTPKALWDALVNPDKTPLYFFGTRIDSTLQKGAPFRYFGPDGNMVLDGEIIDIVPEKRLETTFCESWMEGAVPTRIVYDIEPMGDVVKLTLTHFDVAKTSGGVIEGWQTIFAGLKTYLETGKPLNVPMPGSQAAQ